MIVAQSPQLLGIGVDEDTAAVVVEDVDGHELLRVVGRGAVTIFDPAHDRHQRLRGQAVRAAAGQRRGAARAAGGRGLRPDHAHAGAAASRCVDPDEAAEHRRGRQRPAPAGPRHRRRRRLPDVAARAGSRPQRRKKPDRPRDTDPTRTEPPDDRTPHPRPRDPRDPGLPRRQRLVLRQGDPPRRRPRLARAVPDQHAARLHRQPPADAARAARALLLARPPRRLRRAAQRGHLARPRRRALRAGAAAGRRPRHPPRQDPPGQGPARATTT